MQLHFAGSARVAVQPSLSAAPLPNKHGRLLLWVFTIFVLALAVRMGLLFTLRNGARVNDYGENIFLARNLSSNGRFANPFGGETGPSAHEMPLYPLFAAAVIRLTSESAAATWFLPICASLAAALEFALLPYVAMSFGWPSWGGILAGLAGALLPVHFWVETTGGVEAVYVGLMLVILMAVCAACFRTGVITRKQALVSGVLGGVGLLLSASILPILAGIALALLWVAQDRVTVAKRLAVSACIACAILSPWITRNAYAFHAFVPFRTNLGLELDYANRDGASPLLEVNQFNGVHQAVHPLVNLQIRKQVATEGEVQFNREKMIEVRGWISHHKQHFAALTAQRIFYFWFPRLHGQLLTVLSGLIAVISFCGLWLAARTSPRAALAVGALWLCFPVVYYFVGSDSRYRYPIWWSMLLMATYFVSSFISPTRSFDKPTIAN